MLTCLSLRLRIYIYVLFQLLSCHHIRLYFWAACLQMIRVYTYILYFNLYVYATVAYNRVDRYKLIKTLVSDSIYLITAAYYT